MEEISTDVLVIGAGAAGIRAALAASEAGADVIVLAKGEVIRAGSTFSSISKGWGIQALVGEERTQKNLAIFYNDIMEVGLKMCAPKLVRILVEESGPRVEEMMAYGIHFKEHSSGGFVRAKGCFSNHERAFVTEDLKNVQKTFSTMLGKSHAKIIRGYALDFITADNACWGAWALVHDNNVLKINAKATVLATGGGAGIFRHHLVSKEEMGEGYALAYRSGATLRNLEFVQFVLGLVTDRSCEFLPLSQLTCGGILEDEDGGDFLASKMPDTETRTKALEYRRQHVPFSCRDASYLIDIAVAQARKGGKRIQWRNSARAVQEEKKEVVHLAHAFNGGVKIDHMAQTSVSGLFAAGEVASGPHGADRIGGCMMTATQVFGRRAGTFGALRAKNLTLCSFPHIGLNEEISWVGHASKCGHDFEIDELERSIEENMDKYATVFRSIDGLSRCEKILTDCQYQLEGLKRQGTIEPLRAFGLRNRIITGKLVVKSASNREKSLGSHFRQDFIFL